MPPRSGTETPTSCGATDRTRLGSCPRQATPQGRGAAETPRATSRRGPITVYNRERGRPVGPLLTGSRRGERQMPIRLLRPARGPRTGRSPGPPGGTVSEYAGHAEDALEEHARRRAQEIAASEAAGVFLERVLGVAGVLA